jgi:rhodanese-related sulfurtransferase
MRIFTLICILVTSFSCSDYQKEAKYLSEERRVDITKPNNDSDNDNLGNPPQVPSDPGQINPPEPDNKKLKEQIFTKFQEYQKYFPQVTNLTPTQVLKLDHIIFVDVREINEYEVSLLPNAMIQKDFEKSQYDKKKVKIIVYCTIGYRSGLYTDKLINDGWEAYNMLGGVLLWSHEKLSFYKNGNKTKKVHIYAKDWNFLHSDYTAVY